MNDSRPAVATLAALATLATLIGLTGLTGLTGCGQFEVQSIVLDLRVLAIQVEPPEVVVPFDPEDLPDGPDDLGEIPEVTVCALIGDPADSRSLRYFMTACAPTDSKRCAPEYADDPDNPGYSFEVGDGTIDDPEEAAEIPALCGTLPPDLNLFTVIQESIENDSLSGFGGVEVQIDLAVFPDGGEYADAQWASKRMLYAPRIPEQRVANKNPSLDGVFVKRGDEDRSSIELGRCRDIAPPTVAPGEKVNFEPAESEGSREDYVVPTFEGDIREFTENHRYRWYATAGEWSAESTGGVRDVAGNEPTLDTDWTAPDEAGDVEFWVVQYDERGGQSWYQTCLRVQP